MRHPIPRQLGKGANHPGSDIDLLVIGNFKSGVSALHHRRDSCRRVLPAVGRGVLHAQEVEKGSIGRQNGLQRAN